MKDAEVVSGTKCKTVLLWLWEGGKCGSYTLCLFIFYVLTLEDRNVSRIKITPLSVFWPLWSTTLSFISEPLQHVLPDPFNHPSFLRVFSDLVKHVSSPQVDGVRSGLPLEAVHGLQMPQRIPTLPSNGVFPEASYLDSLRPGLLFSHNYED